MSAGNLSSFRQSLLIFLNVVALLMQPLFFVIRDASMLTAPDANDPHKFSEVYQLLHSLPYQQQQQQPQQTQQQQQQQQQQPPEDEPGWSKVNIFVGPQDNLEERFAKYLNKKRGGYSQIGQDVAVSQLLSHKTHGYFVDLAANHPVIMSNTFLLELKYQWHGLCIEPNQAYWTYHFHRPRCNLVAAVVGGGPQSRMQPITFAIPKKSGRYASAGIQGKDFDNKPLNETDPKDLYNTKIEKNVQTMYTVPLTEILTKHSAPPVIDYLSLDVEGAEHFVMKDFDFDRFKIRIITIERPKQELIDLLYSHGYVYLGSFSPWGDETLWIHRSEVDTVNMTAVPNIVHTTSTRVMEVDSGNANDPQSLVDRKAPKIIAEPMEVKAFEKFLKRPK